MYEKDDLVDALLEDNSARRKRQKMLDIRVIVANPPYSVGQTDANDDNQNVSYPSLDERIAATYASGTEAVLKNSLYDSYIRAIRWASDRIGDRGVIGFVTNAGYLDSASGNGLRKCLVEEFSSLYVFNLRGNQRTSGELSRKEGGKIFGSGSRAPIAISLLVKNPDVVGGGHVFYRDIGDYLSAAEKLTAISEFADVSGIAAQDGWKRIEPDSHGDWIRQRDSSFSAFIPVAGRDLPEDGKIFLSQSGGIKSNRDAWCFNASRAKLLENVNSFVEFYSQELVRLSKAPPTDDVEFKTNNDPTRISWTRGLRERLMRKRPLVANSQSARTALYRPYSREWVYLDPGLIEVMSRVPAYFQNDAPNVIIWTTGIGATVPYSCWISEEICSLQQGPAAVQHLPLYVFDSDKTGREGNDDAGELFSGAGLVRRDGISNGGLAHFQKAYPSEAIAKEDVFYYVYGLLHSPDYRDRYADNLSKELPRIPCVKSAVHFWALSKAGRALADLHLHYESVAMYLATVVGGKNPLTDADYRVEKMRYGKQGKERDLTTIHYNDRITVSGIPVEAYEYVVNGKSAIDWVMERQCVKTDKDSGIVNDANDWAIETMHNPKYPLELLLRVITVSVETMKIVKDLPKLDIRDA